MLELERYDPALGGRIKYEHFHRYAFACEQVAGLRVLDIASGEGYGSAMLATAAAEVVGVDVDPQAVATANLKYGKKDRVSFHLGRAQDIPFPDKSFDAVVSFETIEHIEDPEALLKEIKRVLKPKGFAIISTPNKSVYNQGLAEPNAFHLREMELAEFVLMLEASFKAVSVYGQRMVIASALSPVSRDSARNSAEYRGYTVKEADEGELIASPAITRLASPEYVVCIVSDATLPQPVGPDSIFLMREHDLWIEHSKVMRWASGLHDEDEALRAALGEATEKARHLDAAQSRIEALTDLRVLQDREIARLSAQVHNGADLSTLGPLLEELSGGPVAADLPTLIRLLNRMAVEKATYDIRLADYAEIKASGKAASFELEEARRKLRDADETTRAQAELVERLTASLEEQGAAHAEEVAALRRRESELQDDWERERIRRGAAEERLAEYREKAEAELADAVAQVERLRDDAARAQRLCDRAAQTVSRTETGRAFGGTSAPSRLRRSSASALASDTGSVTPDAVRELHDARFSETLRARRGEAALAAVKSVRTVQEAMNAVSARRSVVQHQLRRSHAALASLPAPKVYAAASRAKSLKGRALALLKERSASNDRRFDPRVSDVQIRTLFDADHYARVNRLSLAFGESALDHYFAHGRLCGLSPHPLIDVNWMREQKTDGTATRFDLVDYLINPDQFHVSPHPLFDAEYYLLHNPDVRDSKVNPLVHFMLYGWREGRAPNVLFDPGWYLAENEDVLRSGMNPLVHYARYGGSERRQPHPLFDRDYYLARNPDVAASGMDAYIHYLSYGKAEGRQPSAPVEEVERYVPLFQSDGAIDLLLGDDLYERLVPAGDFWPPLWDGRYWLPQKLRDLIIDRYGLEQLDLYIYLFSLIDRFSDNPAGFESSEDCARLISRAKCLAKLVEDIEPTVSIIVPVYNNLLYTLTCVVSLLELDHAYSFEIIIADDQSSDATKDAIEEIGGVVRLHRNSVNLGFLQNCNAAAGVAQGDYLVMLNNDVIVLPGWLDGLIRPMVANPKIGFVGSKLINSDGTLQEAGGIVWRDGSAWNYGRNGDPSLPEFNYLKDTDYVSGASIAIPRKVWDEVAGFDPLFAPAYCEDSDIAFRIRAHGYRTIYQPHSVLVHHEGRSHGRDAGAGIKAYQVVNQRKFLERWGDVLNREHFPNGEQIFLARDRTHDKPRILIVDHYVPQWDRDAGSRTIYQYIRMLLDHGFAVTFWPDNLHEDREYAAPLQALGVEVIYHPAYVGRFSAWLAENARHFDYAFLCRPHVAGNYIDEVRRYPNIKIVYYGVDLHCRRLQTLFELTGDPGHLAEAVRWEAIERQICGKCDVVLYPGRHEAEVVRSWVGDDVAVLNFPITIFSDQELDEGLANLARVDDHDPFNLMFVGGFSHHPNVGGVMWFVQEVFSRLRAADPRFHIRIAGSNAPPEIRRLASDHVVMLGRVSDDELMKMYRTAGMAVVPLLYGAGVKGKVIEAMARGVPLAMTSIGAQGIEGAEALAIVEDDPQRLADAILASVNNRSESVRKAEAAVEFIRRWYSKDAVHALLLPHIPELGSRS